MQKVRGLQASVGGGRLLGVAGTGWVRIEIIKSFNDVQISLTLDELEELQVQLDALYTEARHNLETENGED